MERVEAVAESAQDTYVVTNNHYLGKAVVNAFEMTSILRGEQVRPPAQLMGQYPELKAYAAPEEVGPQQLLLGENTEV